MKKEPDFLSLKQVLELHRRLIKRFGGDAGLRDPGLLESAVAMPAARYGGEFLHDGLAEMGAAYLFHICKNHPFVDGNKRTALSAALVFLEANGCRLRASEDELEELALGVADGSCKKEKAAAFFKKHLAKRS